MFAALAGLLGLEIKDRAARLIKAAVLGAIALVLLLTSAGYLLGWVKFKLLAYYDAPTVDLILFGAFLLLGLIFTLSAYMASKAGKKNSTAAAALAAVPLAASVATSRLPGAAKAVPLVIIGGLLLGRYFANRE